MIDNNRLPPQDKMDGLIQRISILSGELYNLMDPGLTIEVMFPTPSNLVIPGKKADQGKLIITKPAMNVHIQIQP